jgi:hypothetical protein
MVVSSLVSSGEFTREVILYPVPINILPLAAGIRELGG